MMLMEALIALLISAVVFAQINTATAGLGKFIRKNRNLHGANLVHQAKQSYAQNITNLSIDYSGEGPGSCVEVDSGSYFSELECGDSESKPIRLLNPRGLSLIELLIAISLSALVLGSLPTIIRSSGKILSTAADFENNVAEDFLLSSLILSQIKRASPLPGIKTIKLHAAGIITDPHGNEMIVSSNIQNRPAPGFNPISFLVPDLSYVLTPSGDGRFCRHYRTSISERRTAVSSIVRYLLVSLAGVFELSGKAVFAAAHPGCPDGTYTIQLQAPNASSTMYNLSNNHSSALLLIPIKDEFTVYTANSLVVRRVSGITTENQPITMQGKFGVIGSVQNELNHRSIFNLEITPIHGETAWEPQRLIAVSSSISPLRALDLLQ